MTPERCVLTIRKAGLNLKRMSGFALKIFGLDSQQMDGGGGIKTIEK